MDNAYISEFMSALECVKIGVETNMDFDYDTGINKLVECFAKHKEIKSQIFFIGNGGSSAIASHMTADYMKNGGMRTCCLYDNAVTTCMGNDYGYEYVFSRPLEYLGQENDLLVAISSSGNSQNIVNAISVAKAKNMDIITFTGFKQNNRSRQLGLINVYVPSEKYGVVESIHNLMLQQIVDLIMERDGI